MNISFKSKKILLLSFSLIILGGTFFAFRSLACHHCPPPQPVCGNGILESGEQCEVGHECSCPEGTVCNVQTCLCEEETPPEPVCGNGVLEGDEECEVGYECECAQGTLCNVQTCLCEEETPPEPVCGNGVLEDGEECEVGYECACSQGTVCNVQTCFCEQEQEPEKLTIFAFKVVCDSEEDLPNWASTGMQSGEPSVITSTTASDYVAASQGKCHLASGWEFQLGPQGQKQAGDLVGPAPEGTGWNNFDSATLEGGVPARVELTELGQGTSQIWVRENLKEGYIPFANTPGDLQDDVSAEMLCHDDILNFDNYDYISNPQLGNTYYCVAFNAPVETPPEPFCGDGNLDPGEECEIGHECVCSPGTVCNTQTCLCEATPPAPVCGNGVLESGEQCDDGNTENGDGCSSQCQTECVCDPEQELIINGGFEEPIVETSQKWDIFSEVSGWNIDWATTEPQSYGGQERPENAYLELHRGVNGWLSYEGQQHAELDTDWDGPSGSLTNEPASVRIYQDIPTIPGYEYQIKFYFSPRPDTGIENNQLEFSWNGEIVDVINAAGSTTTVWSEYTYIVASTATTTRIQFTDMGVSDSLGTFLDDVSVRCYPSQQQGCSDSDSDGYYAYDEVYCTEGNDCDDSNPSVNPGAAEVCSNQIDDDCDGDIDCDDSNCAEDPACDGGGPTCTNYYLDSDSDTYGVSEDYQCLMATSGDYTATQGGDCDDSNSSVHPGAAEICDNQIDDDCDGYVDSADPDCAFTPTVGGGGWTTGAGHGCVDYDSDGYYAYHDPLCLVGDDCNDSDSGANPGAAEVCSNQKDDDCDGDIDCDDADCAEDSVCTGEGGVGGGGELIIFDEKHSDITIRSVVISWLTNIGATTQIIYSAEDEPHLLNESNPPYYGYAHAYPEPKDENLVISHSVFIWGLRNCTTYYYRAVSSASPAVFSPEYSFTTKCPVVSPALPPELPETEGGTGGEIPPVVEEEIIPEEQPSGEGEEEMVEEEVLPELAQNRIGNFFANLLAAAGNFASGLFGKSFNCLPCWTILVLIVYSLVKSSNAWNRKRKRKALIWFIWAFALIVLAVLFRLQIMPCFSIWMFVILALITLLIRWYTSKKKKSQ